LISIDDSDSQIPFSAHSFWRDPDYPVDSYGSGWGSGSSGEDERRGECVCGRGGEFNFDCSCERKPSGSGFRNPIETVSGPPAFPEPAIFCGLFLLTPNPAFCIMTSPKTEFFACQARPRESGWLRSQPEKVSRPSEPSFVSLRVTLVEGRG